MSLNKTHQFLLVEAGKAVTLQYTLEDKSSNLFIWYKLPVGQLPQQVGMTGPVMGAILFAPFKNFRLERTKNTVSLTIPHATKEDEGMYFCGISQVNVITFTSGTYLAVSGESNLTSSISVLQTPVEGPFSPGESVTLQCTVLSEIRAADLRVLWFRAAAGQSFPEIIYTHQNSSSRQCEISSSTHSSVYNFSRNILNHHHTGTYYCAVAACGRIIFGNGTTVELTLSGNFLMVSLTMALGVSIIVILAQAAVICKWRNCGRCGEKLQLGAVIENTIDQDRNPEILNYAPVHFKKKRTESREKREQNDIVVYSQGNSIPSDAAGAVDIYQRQSFVSTKPGEAVTLQCTLADPQNHHQLNISVLQTPVQGPVSPGEPVTLQCTVLSEIRAADLRVLWFRAAAGQSFPEIIYTHQNSSSRQCEISSSTHSSVYNFSRNILNHHHTGTYYCTVAACGRINIGNGTSVEMRQPQDLTLIFLSAALVVCVVVISAQAVLICKRRSCEPCSDKMSQFVLHNIPEELQDQDPEAEDFIFAPLNFYVKKRLLLKENVFTRVGFLPVSDYRSIKRDDIAEKIRN
ncbi:hypothetical protein NFI96_002005 [Prochilodus magdalenae]|nr:hypothetical protein NFI96_002005 [Prochilodus magdalenae]